jgi:formylglycine-generating enzyme required for sulfatase activity
MVTWLLKVVETLQALNPLESAKIGRVLGLLGCPRSGVGLRPDRLPDIVWSEVPAGDFIMGSDQDSDNPKRTAHIEPAYAISKYPITYEYFQTFIEAADGWHNPMWWERLAATEHHKAQPDEQAYKYENHPRERVSWHNAVAFCRWLSAKVGYEVRLPTEREWERVARLTDGLAYPYGGEFNAAKGNTRYTGIGHTSADGASVAEAHYLSGNVLDCCLTAYEQSTQRAEEKDMRSNTYRVIRGGSWLSNRDYARVVPSLVLPGQSLRRFRVSGVLSR